MPEKSFNKPRDSANIVSHACAMSRVLAGDFRFRITVSAKTQPRNYRCWDIGSVRILFDAIAFTPLAMLAFSL